MSEILPKIDADYLPKHVAVIMDGNGRWAQSMGKERTFGHQSAIRAVRDTINACNEIGIPYLTLYTFSTENWSRPGDEVDALMSLLSETLLAEAEDIFNKGLRLHVIGDIEKLPALVQEQLQNVMDITAKNTRGNLVLALSYGSRKEIISAVQKISEKVKIGELQPSEISEEIFSQNLYTKDIPDVDLLIRTSGEVRVSNFLLWQIAYAEMQFLNILWPDFCRADFYNCIAEYQKKERRYGKTSAQINSIQTERDTK